MGVTGLKGVVGEAARSDTNDAALMDPAMLAVGELSVGSAPVLALRPPSPSRLGRADDEGGLGESASRASRSAICASVGRRGTTFFTLVNSDAALVLHASKISSHPAVRLRSTDGKLRLSRWSVSLPLLPVVRGAPDVIGIVVAGITASRYPCCSKPKLYLLRIPLSFAT